jgi:gamma-glutamyltranspeptidase/glutathione hydrolase
MLSSASAVAAAVDRGRALASPAAHFPEGLCHASVPATGRSGGRGGLAGCAATSRRASPRRAAPKAQAYVVAANPLAAQAGMNVLRRGGSAVDAAIAVEAMLSLVEPQSSGVGGGAFMTHYDAGTRRVSVYDGRETAPAGATPDMFIGAGGQPLSFPQAVVSGRATGVPGVLRMLELAHREHGRLAWRDLFGDAERTARDGFIVGPRLGRFTNASYPQTAQPDVRAYFAEADGTPVDLGDRLRNPAYADFLRGSPRRAPTRCTAAKPRRADRRAHRRRAAAGDDDPGRPGRLPP